MAKQDTKSLLLDHGVRLMLGRGYHHTGIHDVLAAAGVPKGSFYYHFKNKEDFGLQVVDRYADDGYAEIDRVLGDKRQPPLLRLQRLFEGFRADYERRFCRDGCLLGNLGQEMADINDMFRDRISTHFDRWTARIALCLDEAVVSGDLSADVDSTMLAGSVLDAYEGALLRMKVVKNTAPVQAFLDVYFNKTLNR
jgi:TetR/AcrR family transcriptional repressor of nem operon